VGSDAGVSKAAAWFAQTARSLVRSYVNDLSWLTPRIKSTDGQNLQPRASRKRFGSRVVCRLCCRERGAGARLDAEPAHYQSRLSSKALDTLSSLIDIGRFALYTKQTAHTF